MAVVGAACRLDAREGVPFVGVGRGKYSSAKSSGLVPGFVQPNPNDCLAAMKVAGPGGKKKKKKKGKKGKKKKK